MGLPKKLFDLASEAVRRRAAQMFGSTPLGRALKRLEQQKQRSGSAMRSILAALKRRHTQSLVRRLSSSTPRETYAKKPTRNVLLKGLFDALGPVGKVFKALMFPVRQAAVALDRQLKAASNLLKAFGYAVIPPPGKKGPGKQAQEEMAEYLKRAGWTVQPPTAAGAGGSSGGGTPPGAPPAAPPPPPSDPNRRPGQVRIGGRWVSSSDPAATGAMIRVQSSNVYSIGWDRDQQGTPAGTLKVTFREDDRGGKGKKRDAPGSTYAYKHVPYDVFRAFQQAASKGSFVWDRLRIRGTVSGHRYDYELAGISQDYVPRKATVEGEHEWYIPRNFVQDGQLLRSTLGRERVRRLGGDVNRGEPNDGRPNRPNDGRPNRPNDGRPRRGN